MRTAEVGNSCGDNNSSSGDDKGENRVINIKENEQKGQDCHNRWRWEEAGKHVPKYPH